MSLTIRPAAAVTESTLNHERFGTLAVYREALESKGTVLFLSGPDGWNPPQAQAAAALAELDYLVVGIDSRRYLASLDAGESACGRVGADLADLGRWLQDRYRLPVGPSLVMGYATGAALVYIALAQAPAATFHAGISLNFCPYLPLRNNACQDGVFKRMPALDGKPMELIAVPRLPAAWFAFQANPDCDAGAAGAFINQVSNARQVSLAAGDNTILQGSAWEQVAALMQWLDPRLTQQTDSSGDVSDVPLVEVLATVDAKSKPLALLLSGDGGWAALDKAVATELAGQGIPTLGWDSLRYFWNARTPDAAAADLEQVLNHYLQAWNRDGVLLIGYSFGADVLPFMANRLSSDLRARIRLVAFLGLSKTATFEFHLTDWISDVEHKDALPVLPEVMRLNWSRRLCIYGAEEEDSACPELTQAGIAVFKMPGDHHFDDDYKGVVQRVLEQLP